MLIPVADPGGYDFLACQFENSYGPWTPLEEFLPWPPPPLTASVYIYLSVVVKEEQIIVWQADALPL